MPDKTEAAATLRLFLEKEKAGKGQEFWVENWFRVKPLAAKADVLLEPDEAERFFFHYLTREDAPPPVPQSALPRLLAAYRGRLPKRDRGGYRDPWHRVTVVFGFTHEGTTPGELRDAATLKARLKLVTHMGKFSHLPGMLAKRAGLQPFADQAGHILDAFRLLGYRLDYGRGENDSYDYSNPSYWGLVLTVLSSRDHRTALLADMIDPALDLPKRAEMHGILNELVQAVLPDCDAGETEFRALAQRLAAQERARSGETESAALARQLGLPFAAGEDWEIVIQAPSVGHTVWYNPPRIKLGLRPDPDNDWKLDLHAGEHRYSDWSGRDTDPGSDLPRLARLADFPAWLRGIGESHGLAFDFAKGRIFCGKKRSAAKTITRWIEGG